VTLINVAVAHGRSTSTAAGAEFDGVEAELAGALLNRWLGLVGAGLAGELLASPGSGLAGSAAFVQARSTNEKDQRRPEAGPTGHVSGS
jgi:hypothetical protein